MVDKERPITPAKSQKVICAAEADILWMRAERKNTKPSGASITTHFSGVPKIAWISSGLWEAAKATLKPYDGPSVKGVDVSTLTGKVVTGYQGWFATPNDGGPLGWSHYQVGGQEPLPNKVCIDFWPDVTELDPDERCATKLVHADGSPAFVFSSRNPKTVNRHFQWMREYGIDAAFVQRFAIVSKSPDWFENSCRVLANCRAGANRNGVGYIVMYDLSDLPSHSMERVKNDWRMLVDGMKLTRDPADKAYPPVTLMWYEGGLKPENRPEWNINELPGSGMIMVGEKQNIITGGRPNNAQLMMSKQEWEDWVDNEMPEATIPRIEGGPQQEFFRAVKRDGPLPGSNFDYATDLTEMALMGVMAQRFNTRIEYDAKSMKVLNNEPLNNYIKEPVRDGWSYGEGLL